MESKLMVPIPGLSPSSKHVSLHARRQSPSQTSRSSHPRPRIRVPDLTFESERAHRTRCSCQFRTQPPPPLSALRAH
eukprot:2091440-Rhodomonas_salina.2